MILLVHLVKPMQKLSRIRFIRFTDFGRPDQVADRLGSIEDHTLMGRRQETRGPVGGTRRRNPPNIWNSHESRKVLIFRSQGVANPSPRAGKTLGSKAGVHLAAGRAMSIAFG